MIRRLAALALLVAGAALHGQTPCAPGPALFHISGFQRDNPPTTDVVYIKLPNKPPLEFLRRISVIEKDGKRVNDKRYLPGEREIRTDFVKQVGEPCISKFYKKIDDLKTDDLFVESSLRGILKQLTESEPVDVREIIAPSQAEIQSLKPEIERPKVETPPPPPSPQTADEYSWKNRPFFFFVGMLLTPLVILARSKWRQRFFRKARMPFPVARRLLINTKAAREAVENLTDSLLSRPPQVTAKAIADAVVEGMQHGQAQADTLLQLLADLPFHPQFLTADLRQRLVTATQPADFLSRKEVDNLVTRQRWDNVRREAEHALHRIRDDIERLDAKSQLRALLNEQFLTPMYRYDDDALSDRNLGNATQSRATETAISVFRRLRRGELLLSTYVIPVLPELEVASAASLLRSLQVAVNEMRILLDLMGIQQDELVLLRQPPPDAEVKQVSNALSTIRERFPNVSRLLQQDSLSGKAVCDFEEVGYSFNNQRQRSVVYELALNKPPRETASKPEPVAPREPPRRAVQVVTTVRQETKPAEITAPPPASLPSTLEAVPQEVVFLRQLLDSGTLPALSREDVRRWTASIDNATTYRDGIWQLSLLCGMLFRKRDTVSAGVLRDALEKCGVSFKDADVGERADMQSDFDKEPHQKAMNLSLIAEAEVKAHRIGAVVKQLAPFIEFDGKVQKGLVVVRFADFF